MKEKRRHCLPIKMIRNISNKTKINVQVEAFHIVTPRSVRVGAAAQLARHRNSEGLDLNSHCCDKGKGESALTEHHAMKAYWGEEV
jgi:hypothetical protein